VIIPTPQGRTLLPYQEEGVLHLIHKRAALLADEQGLGKTVQVASAINCAAPGVKVFIGCPNSLVLNWVYELKEWLTAPRTIGIVTPAKIPETDILIAHYDIFHRISGNLCSREFNIAILDEAHRIKSPDAKCTVSANCIKAWTKWLLTGTPIQNRPREAWSLINWALSGQFIDYMTFSRYYCNGHLRTQVCKFRNKKTGKLDSRPKKIWDDKGASNLEALHSILIDRVGMLRRRKEDVLKDLPAKRHQVIEIQPPRGVMGGETAVINALGGYDEAVARLQSGAPIGFEDFAKVRAELALAKTPYAVDILEDILASVDKVVVFFHHREVGLTLAARLKSYGPALAMGGMDVAGAAYQFQTNPDCRVFIGNDVAREGLTLTAAQIGVFVELDPVPGNMDQMEDRLHRIGQLGSVLIQALVFSGSLDAHLLRLVWKKQRVIDQAVNGNF